MGTYALILFLFLGGVQHTYTMDTGLSYTDCMVTIAANVGTNLACELE